MATFSITFDRDTRRYISGETIHCQVSVTVLDKFKARSLSLRFIGAAHTGWTIEEEKKVNGNTIRETVPYSGDEEYFRFNQYLVGREHGEALEILPGNYIYQGSFTIPTEVPTSIEHEHGYVRYSVMANYDIPWGIDKSQTEIFFVTAHFNLNEFSYLADPVKEVEEKTFCCFFCKSDPLQLVMNIPKSGYVPGESIPVTIEVDNNSDVAILSVEVKLQEKLTFYTRFPESQTQSDYNKISEHTFDAVAAYQKKLFQTEFFLDPGFNWKRMNKCGIIHSEYVIETIAEVSGCHMNASVDKKLMIGTIPLGANSGDFQPMVPMAPMPVMPMMSNSNSYEKNGLIDKQPMPTYNNGVPFGPPSLSSPGHSGLGWTVAPVVAPDEKSNLLKKDDLPPSFEECQKLPKMVPNAASVPSAPPPEN